MPFSPLTSSVPLQLTFSLLPALLDLDTTSNSSCAIFYHLASNREALVKLQVELDGALAHLDPLSSDLPSYDDVRLPFFSSQSPSSQSSRLTHPWPFLNPPFQVKSLSWLEKVIDEGLRVHSTSGIGLARIVPEDGAIVCGRFFEPGTVLSVPVRFLPLSVSTLAVFRMQGSR